MRSKFSRPVMPGEHQWLAADMIRPPFVNQMVLEGAGTMELDELTDAVARASEANPGSRLILKGALRSCYWLDSGVVPPVRRISGSRWDGYSQEHAPFLNDRLPGEGPTCEVLWVEEPKPRLIFRSNHGVMDGRGTWIWAEDVFRALRGEELLGSLSSITKLDIITGVTDRSSWSDAVKCIAPTGKSLPGASGVVWRRVSFTGQFPKLLGKLAWVLAQSAWQYDDGRVRFLVSVDLRPRKPGVRSTANLNAGLSVGVGRDSTPDSIRQDILDQLENKNDCVRMKEEGLLDVVPLGLLGFGLRMLSKYNHSRGRYDITAVISNLGMVDTAKFRGGGFHAKTVFFIPPQTELIPLFLVFTGCPGREELCVSMPQGLAGGGRFERLLSDIRRALAPDAVPESADPEAANA